MTELLYMKQSICFLKLKKKKINTFDAAYYRGKSYFEEDGTQNYLVIQRACKYFEELMFQKLLLNFMLIHRYQKYDLLKILILSLDLNVHLMLENLMEVF